MKLSQLKFSNNYSFPDSSWEAVTYMVKSGNEVLVLHGNGGLQFLLDEHVERCFSAQLSD